MNSFKHFARYMNDEWKPIPSSIVAEGDSYWNGAGDRGDAAMIAYGAARYALASGNKEEAKQLWPLIEWCLEFNRRKINEGGVVASDSDELEGRFPAGKANLCTSSLYYDALLSAAYLAEELGKGSAVSKEYRKQAAQLRQNMDSYFAAEVEGFDTYAYYKGNDVKNNYLLFSGMLFRIVKANDDGSIMIISDESVTNLRINHTDYKNSNVDTWLNNVYFKALHNTDDYLIDATYCVGNINSLIDYNNECDTKITSKVGLLSIGDYQKTVVNNDTYLDNGNYYALSHMIGNNYATVPIENDTMYGLRSSILGGIRPVLNLKSNLYIVSGKGTSDSPYKLGDYNYGEKNEEIHDRLIGEYLEYSGLTFRIIGVDSNKNVRLIMSKPWDVKPNNEQLKLSVAEVDNLEFNLTDTNNPGYILNHNDIDYISSKYIVDTDYSIPTNDEKLLYQEYSSKKIKAKILLSKTYELFSSIGNDDISRNTGFLYIDKSVNDNMIFMANGNNGLMYEFSKDTFYSYSIKAVITIKGSLKISSGNGTVNKPYIIK